MQAVKDKFQEMNEMRKAKAEARAEEKAEKEIAKARMDIAHEVRLAREAEAAMDVHVNKAAEKADRAVAKHGTPNQQVDSGNAMDAYGSAPGGSMDSYPGAAPAGVRSTAGAPSTTPAKKMA